MKKIYTYLFIGLMFIAVAAQAYDGKIINAQTKAPIEGAIVTLSDVVVRSAADGSFHINGTGATLRFRAPGYARKDVASSSVQNANAQIALTPFIVKGLYLSTYGFAEKKIRTAALATIKKNNLNALVIDFKGDEGEIIFPVDVPLAKEIGAQKTIAIKDMPARIAELKSQGLYVIARIVVFKDDPLAAAKPEWQVKKNGAPFRDRQHYRWVDPFNHAVWDYNIALAKAAADMGFDEVQFDYVRFPDAVGIQFSQPSTDQSRTAAITGFLSAAHQALAPSNVMVAADIFGYTAWNNNDTGIGQTVENSLNSVDIISPMLYPSGFADGIPNYRNPVQHPYEIVLLTLKRAQERTHASPLRFRPWLQAFRDYAFGGVPFREDKMRLQIKAANDFGASGYLFWNAGNIYPSGNF